MDKYDFPKKTPDILLVSNSAPLSIPLSVTLSSLFEAQGKVLKLQSVSKSLCASQELATREPRGTRVPEGLLADGAEWRNPVSTIRSMVFSQSSPALGVWGQMSSELQGCSRFSGANVLGPEDEPPHPRSLTQPWVNRSAPLPGPAGWASAPSRLDPLRGFSSWQSRGPCHRQPFIKADPCAPGCSLGSPGSSTPGIPSPLRP